MTDGLPLVCGIDAGGTKTDCALATLDGALVARTVGAAGRLDGDGRAVSAVAEIVRDACARADVAPADLALVVAGLSGVDTPAAERHAHEQLSALLDARELIVRNDAEIALAAAISARPAVVLIAGTGSIAFGETADGRSERVGGWGHLLGDEGSGYDVAARALRAVLRSLDGRAPATGLTHAARVHFALDGAAQLVELTDAAALDPGLLAAFAPLVLALARDGDALAAQAVDEAAHALAEQAVVLMRRLGAEAGCPVTLAGGVLTHEPAYAQAVGARILAAAPATRLVRSTTPPVGGAVLSAIAQLAGAAALVAARARLEPALSSHAYAASGG